MRWCIAEQDRAREQMAFRHAKVSGGYCRERSRGETRGLTCGHSEGTDQGRSDFGGHAHGSHRRPASELQSWLRES